MDTGQPRRTARDQLQEYWKEIACEVFLLVVLNNPVVVPCLIVSASTLRDPTVVAIQTTVPLEPIFANHSMCSGFSAKMQQEPNLERRCAEVAEQL